MLRGNLRNRRSYFGEEDANPMEGAINIVDAMLVFACGLMLSLVIFWNVDIGSASHMTTGDIEEMEAMETIKEEIQKTIDGEAEYERLGVVYRDPNTGQMYMVNEGGE